MSLPYTACAPAYLYCLHISLIVLHVHHLPCIACTSASLYCQMSMTSATHFNCVLLSCVSIGHACMQDSFLLPMVGKDRYIVAKQAPLYHMRWGLGLWLIVAKQAPLHPSRVWGFRISRCQAPLYHMTCHSGTHPHSHHAAPQHNASPLTLPKCNMPVKRHSPWTWTLASIDPRHIHTQHAA